MTQSNEEVERKYDVESDVVFPNLADTEGVTSVGQPTELHHEAVYFDTPDLDLARNRVTLRRRSGGTDAGWHLKLPSGPDARTELREPLGAEDVVPVGLRVRVRAIARDQPLEPVVRVRTVRRQYPLRNAGGQVLAYVCDDRVDAQRLDDRGSRQQWREWEVELAAAPRSLLDAVQDRLLAAGGTAAACSSKLSRALGDRSPCVTTSEPETMGAGSVRSLLQRHLAEHTIRLIDDAARVRAEQGDALHRLRIAARRLRSLLTTFRPLLNTDISDPLRDELRWLGEALAQARDAMVLREHLMSLLAHEPSELVMGPVAADLDDRLHAEETSGRAAALQALDSERYEHLLDSLDRFIASPPLLVNGDRSAEKAFPKLLARDVKRLRRAVRAIDDADGPQQRDLAFHEARKKAKRLRYAAEAATPVLGKPARSLASATKRVQKALGTHQDSVVARNRLREWGVRAHLDGGNAFSFGRLHALEQARADRAEADFAVAWAKLSKKQLPRWTR